MSQEEKNQQTAAPTASQIEDANEKLIKEAIEKYKELYSYSTDILIKEHERFNRADEKASKFASMFFFLIGAVAFFDKWIFDRLQWPHNLFSVLLDLPLVITGVVTLIASAAGLILAHHAIKVRPVVSRPLDKDVLDFFENETRITIYYGLAKENSKAYAENKKATDAKYTLLQWAYYIMLLVFVLLAILAIMYIACVSIDKMQISFNYGEAYCH